MRAEPPSVVTQVVSGIWIRLALMSMPGTSSLGGYNAILAGVNAAVQPLESELNKSGPRYHGNMEYSIEQTLKGEIQLGAAGDARLQPEFVLGNPCLGPRSEWQRSRLHRQHIRLVSCVVAWGIHDNFCPPTACPERPGINTTRTNSEETE
ncbi:hypothetical protein LZ30DRAFT_407899 [Colletotrichum cereale]|nr:hypothetical protein LZ30DRAFT_407899 [Colletotrichum cereale]